MSRGAVSNTKPERDRKKSATLTHAHTHTHTVVSIPCPHFPAPRVMESQLTIPARTTTHSHSRTHENLVFPEVVGKARCCCARRHTHSRGALFSYRCGRGGTAREVRKAVPLQGARLLLLALLDISRYCTVIIIMCPGTVLARLGRQRLAQPAVTTLYGAQPPVTMMMHLPSLRRLTNPQQHRC